MKTAYVSASQVRYMIYRNKIRHKAEMTVRFCDIPQNVLKRVISALERGFLLAWSGPAAEMFELVTQAYGIPAVRVRREMETRWQYPRWIFNWGPNIGLNSKKMDDLFKADQVAIRMADEAVKEKIGDGRRYAWGGSHCLYMLKDPKMLEEAFAEAMEPYQAQIKEAIRAIEGGESILITHS
jgi:hypothetical protein